MAKSLGCSKLVQGGQPPNEACLQAAAAHVAHDLDLLKLIWEQRHTRLGWTLWFLAARSLEDFFFRYERPLVDKKKRLYSDDILASDYLPTGTWKSTAQQLKKQEPPDIRSVRRAANKLSAHLTYARVDKTDRGSSAPSETVNRFILGVSAVWLSKLPPERRVWFGAA